MTTSLRLILTGAVLSASVAMAAPPPAYKVIKKIALGGDGGWDYLTVDPAGHRVFISRGTRVMVVDTETEKLVGEIPDTPGVDEVLDTIKTEPGARTMTIDPKTHTIYLVTAQFGPRPAPTPENPRGRPPILPGSFVLLAIGH